MRIALPGVFCYSQFNFLRRYLVQLKITKMPLVIIFVTTSLHFLWCHLFVNVFEWGLYGGAGALSLTYFLDMVCLYAAAFYFEGPREGMDFNWKDSFSGWGQYLKIATPATGQLVILWWYFEILTLLAGIFPDPSQQAA